MLLLLNSSRSVEIMHISSAKEGGVYVSRYLRSDICHSLIVALVKIPLLTDPVDTYAEMSRKKHPFNLLHKLYDTLRRLCKINTETAKNG